MIIKRKDVFVYEVLATKEELQALNTVLVRDIIHNGPTIVSQGIDTAMLLVTIDNALLSKVDGE